MKTGFVVEYIIENCSCNHPKFKLMDVDQDLFEAQTEDYNHYVDASVGGRCRECNEEMLLDIHFVVTDETPDALNPQFWDCECEENYIHMKANKPYCAICHTVHWDQPDSRQNEVEKYLLEPSPCKS